MQTILVLFGSPNDQGYTATLCNLYLEQYKKALHDEVEVKHICLYQQCILPCIGCNKCKQTGECFQKEDDAESIFNQMDKADHIILASPMYFYGFPSSVKVLIDRAQPRYVNKFLSGDGKNKRLRKGSLIATCGSEDTSGFCAMSSCTKQFFDCMDTAFAGKLFAYSTDNPKKMKIVDEV